MTVASYKRIFSTLTILAAALALGHLILTFLYFRIGDIPRTLRTLCYLNCENCFPSYFSGLLLLTVAITLAHIFVIAQQPTKSFSSWLLLSSATFLYLACDETLMIHERVIPYVKNHLGVSPTLAILSWIVPALAFFTLYVITSLKTLLLVSARIRQLLINGGALFVAGAVGYEIMSFLTNSHSSGSAQLDLLLIGIEESLEMTGVLTFLYGLILILKCGNDAFPSPAGNYPNFRAQLIAAILRGIFLGCIAVIPGVLTILASYFIP